MKYEGFSAASFCKQELSTLMARKVTQFGRKMKVFSVWNSIDRLSTYKKVLPTLHSEGLVPILFSSIFVFFSFARLAYFQSSYPWSWFGYDMAIHPSCIR